VIGKDHRRAGRNNQDAVCLTVLPTVIAAIVCDGCSGSKYSEVGAQLGARLMSNELAQLLNSTVPSPDITTESKRIRRALSRTTEHLLSQISIMTRSLGGSFSQTIDDYFLFTLIGTIITPEITTIFSLGDGLTGLNGEIKTLGPFPGNYPPYLAYELLRDEEQRHFLPEINRELPTAQVVSVIIATDGIFDFVANGSRNLPGSTEPLGALDQFWYDDRYFGNTDLIRRRLTLANREVKNADWHRQTINTEHGLLNDDTTIAVIRRQEEG